MMAKVDIVFSLNPILTMDTQFSLSDRGAVAARRFRSTDALSYGKSLAHTLVFVRLWPGHLLLTSPVVTPQAPYSSTPEMLPTTSAALGLRKRIISSISFRSVQRGEIPQTFDHKTPPQGFLDPRSRNEINCVSLNLVEPEPNKGEIIHEDTRRNTKIFIIFFVFLCALRGLNYLAQCTKSSLFRYQNKSILFHNIRRIS